MALSENAPTDEPLPDSDPNPIADSQSPSTKPYRTDDQGRRVYDITSDGKVRKIVITANENAPCVSEHILGRVWMNIKGSTRDGTVFLDHLFEEKEVTLGKAEESKAIDQALTTMHHGDHVIVEVDDVEQYGYSKDRAPDGFPTSNALSDRLPVRYEVVVMDSLPKQRDSQEMTFQEQLQWADLLRERGNIRYEKERFMTALSLYQRAIRCLNAMNDVDMAMPQELAKETKVTKQEVQSLKVKCYLNCCICNLRAKDYGQSIEFATKALEIDGDCKKGLLRRGLGRFEMGQFDEAKADMMAFQKLANEKEDKLAKKYLMKIQAAKHKALEREKRLYGGFLDKKSSKRVSLYDDKEKGNGSNAFKEEGFWWSLVMAIPNFVMEQINECTKFCRKKSKSN